MAVSESAPPISDISCRKSNGGRSEKLGKLENRVESEGFSWQTRYSPPEKRTLALWIEENFRAQGIFRYDWCGNDNISTRRG